VSSYEGFGRVFFSQFRPKEKGIPQKGLKEKGGLFRRALVGKRLN